MVSFIALVSWSEQIATYNLGCPKWQENAFKKRKIKEQMKIILAQYLEIFQISSSGKIYNKNIMK